MLAGTTGSGGFVRDLWTIQCDVNGNLDPTFGTNGWEIQNIGSGDATNGVDVQPDGKIVVGGVGVFSNNDMVVVRYLGCPIGMGVVAIPNAVGFTTFPVPGEGSVLNVRLEGSEGPALFTLLDLHNRVLLRNMVSAPSRAVALVVSALSAGTYLIELSTAKGPIYLPEVVAH